MCAQGPLHEFHRSCCFCPQSKIGQIQLVQYGNFYCQPASQPASQVPVIPTPTRFLALLEQADDLRWHPGPGPHQQQLTTPASFWLAGQLNRNWGASHSNIIIIFNIIGNIQQDITVLSV